MHLPYPILIGFLSAILGVIVVYRLTLGAQALRSKRAAQANLVAGRQVGQVDEPILREPRTLADRLRAAGWNLGGQPETAYRLVRIVEGMLAAVLVLVLGFPMVLAVAAGGLGWYLPQMVLESQETRRALVIEKELPDALSDLVALLRVTPSLKSALDQTRALLVRMNPRSPLGQELQWTLEDLATDEAQAFRDMARRAVSPALAMFAFALGIFSRSGGDYLDALEKQARGIRQTLEARGTAQAEAADAMMAVKIIPVLLIGVTVFLMQDPYFRAFYFSLGGQILLIVVASLMFVGYRVVQSSVQNVI
ncbi:MAG: hypothetical protein HZB51_15350 [Chloroflexi bacterium]|nr:hypothetical protein [Chloroflexota bacterium]